MTGLVMIRFPEIGRPTEAQMRSGRYKKRAVEWNGLTLRIENEAGSFRRGRKPDGTEWETLMHFAYGEVARSEGSDGDPVDVFLGPYMDTAPLVYVVHQRKVGDWEAYDEDKCMLGFNSEQDAIDAFLSSYDDPRFLGPITAMPVAEFVAKVKATKEAPGMVKSIEPGRALIFAKSHVGAYMRRGHMVRGYENGRSGRGPTDNHQLSLFPTVSLQPPPEAAQGKSRKHYVTMIREPGTAGQKTAWLAGPFDDHAQALAMVGPAREAALAADPFSHFDAFGTASREAEKHPPGVLNSRLGLAA